MPKIIVRTLARSRRHFRGRKKIVGTPDRPRLSVFRSEKNILAQLIDDTKGITMSSSSTRDKEFKTKAGGKIKHVEAAKLVGNLLATKAKAKKIERAVFDKSGYAYHGRVKALAEGARDGGLKF